MSNGYRVILIIGICLLVLSAIGGMLWWWPAATSYQDLKTQFGNKDNELKEKREYFAKLNAALDKVKGYEEPLSKVESAFPEDADIAIPTLFNFIIGKASEGGLLLKGVSGDIKGLKAGESGIEEFPFSISADGSYPDFKNFLSAIYKNVRMIDVTAIRFTSPESQSEKLYNFSVSLVTYLDTGSLAQAAEGAEGGSTRSPKER